MSQTFRYMTLKEKAFILNYLRQTEMKCKIYNKHF